MKSNGFILLLLASVLVAYIFPSAVEVFRLEPLLSWGIGLIFFFYGIKISPREFKAGFLRLPVHLFIHLCTFLVFPLLVLAMLPFFAAGTQDPLWLALFFLGALPSTVSSSVVMVSIARGNVPVAIFSASVSGLIGVFITPLWLNFFIGDTGQYDLFHVIVKLFVQILVPLFLGLLLQSRLGAFARRNKDWISLYDKTIIAVIVYSSFASAFASGLFGSIGIWDLCKIFLLVAVLFALIYWVSGYVTRKFNWPLEDRIAAQFCGSKKSLVHGSAMATIFFGSAAINAVFLLPIMLYHMLQLLYISYAAQKMGRRELDQ